MNVSNGAANAIPWVQLGTYIFIPFSVCEVNETWRVAIRECEMLIEQLNKRKQ